MSCEELEKTLGIPEKKILHIVRLRARYTPHDEIERIVGGISKQHIERVVEIIESGDHVLRPKYQEWEAEYKKDTVKAPIASRKRQFEMYQEIYDQAQGELKNLADKMKRLRGPKGATPKERKEFRARETKRCEDMRLRYMDISLSALDSARRATAEPLNVSKVLLHEGSEKDTVEMVLRLGKELMETNVISKEQWAACLPLAMPSRVQ